MQQITMLSVCMFAEAWNPTPPLKVEIMRPWGKLAGHAEFIPKRQVENHRQLTLSILFADLAAHRRYVSSLLAE